MGERLKPIVGRSPIFEENRMREENKRRQQRRLLAEKRRKSRQRKRIATLVFFMCVIFAGIGAIVKVLT